MIIWLQGRGSRYSFFYSVYAIFTFDEELCPLFGLAIDEAIDKNKNNGERDTHE